MRDDAGSALGKVPSRRSQLKSLGISRQDVPTFTTSYEKGRGRRKRIVFAAIQRAAAALSLSVSLARAYLRVAVWEDAACKRCKCRLGSLPGLWKRVRCATRRVKAPRGVGREMSAESRGIRGHRALIRPGRVSELRGRVFRLEATVPSAAPRVFLSLSPAYNTILPLPPPRSCGYIRPRRGVHRSAARVRVRASVIAKLP